MVIWFFLFFFKQKTAYEMRISDWSSDVCSSDLIAGANRWCQRNRNAAGKDWWFADGLDHCGIPSNAALAEVAVVHDDGQVRAIGGEQFDIAQGIAIDQDRKSVVEGKSVSVRVDVGGRRIIKKKSKKKKQK